MKGRGADNTFKKRRRPIAIATVFLSPLHVSELKIHATQCWRGPIVTAHVMWFTHGNRGEDAAASTQTRAREDLFVPPHHVYSIVKL